MTEHPSDKLLSERLRSLLSADDSSIEELLLLGVAKAAEIARSRTAEGGTTGPSGGSGGEPIFLRGKDPTEKPVTSFPGDFPHGGLKSNGKKPLIFVPGIMGSQIFERSNDPAMDVRIWPPSIFRERVSIMKLVDLAPNKKKAVGLFPGIYDILIAYLDSIGYKQGINFWIFAYDWTQSNRVSGDQLHALINQVLSLTGSSSVDIVCHSMGGLVTRSAIVLGGAAVDKVAYIASPHWGAPKALFALHPDITYDVLGVGRLGMLASEVIWDYLIAQKNDPTSLKEALKILARAAESVYELLPDEYYFASGGFVIDVQGIQSPAVRLTDWSRTYLSGPSALPTSYHPHVTRAMAFKSSLGGTPVPLDPRRRLLIYSDLEDTDDRVRYRDYSAVPGLRSGFESPFDSGQHGDGTVPTVSARAGLPAAQRVNGTHTALPNQEGTLRELGWFLLENHPGNP